MLTNVDNEGNAIKMPIRKNRAGESVEAKSIKIDFSKVAVLNTFEREKIKAINKAEITDFDLEKYKNLKEYYDTAYKDFVASFDYKEDAFVVIDKKGNSYTYDTEKETIIKTDKNQKETHLGNGKINIKAAYKKATKTKDAVITVTVELTKDLEKDYEIIPYSPDETVNRQTIETFMDKYVTRPFEYLENVVGVELNFNKEFYVPETLRTVAEIHESLESLENELIDLENELSL